MIRNKISIIIVILVLIILFSILLSCVPGSSKYEIEVIELSDRWETGISPQDQEMVYDIVFDGDDIWCGGYVYDENDINRIPTVWKNLPANEITLPMVNAPFEGASIKHLAVFDGDIHAVLVDQSYDENNKAIFYYFDGTDYTTTISDGTIIYNAIDIIKKIGDDLYLIARHIDKPDPNDPDTWSDTAIAVFKNGVKEGNIVLDDTDIVRRRIYLVEDIYVDDTGLVYIPAGWGAEFSDTSISYYAGYWTNDGSAFEKAGIVEGHNDIQKIESMAGPDSYVVYAYGEDGYIEAIVNGESVTFDLPTSSFENEYRLVNIGEMASVDGNIYITGLIGYQPDPEILSWDWHPVVWNGDGSYNYYMDLNTMEWSEYDYEKDTNNIIAVKSKDNYAINLNSMTRLDKYRVTGYLTKSPK